MVVMSEFLLRGYNVAVPEIDIGDDIYVVEDENGNLGRVQVKAANCDTKKNGYSGQVNVKFSQLIEPKGALLTYVFVLRHQDQWGPFIVIPRKRLYDEHDLNGVGTHSNGYPNVVFTLSYNRDENTLTCSGRDFSEFLNNWSDWPPVQSAG